MRPTIQHPKGTKQARASLAGDASCVRRARTFIETTLGEWKFSDQVDTAVLLTSELVTNAVVHARSGIEVHVQYRPEGVLRIEVVDDSFREPFRLNTASPDATAGRGLAILDTLASRWGVETLDTGKAVWFELAEYADC
jgi:anti-sigma regulatory factor (Ser/Thr protein kinase)